MARLLCEAGTDKDSATALMLASVERRMEVMRLLCEVGAEKDMASQDGATT